jgi:hypothetical protein
MAIKSEFPDETGFALFDEWSQQVADGYDVGAVRGTWRSIKAGGGVSVGTLLHMAKGYGFKPPKMRQPPVAPSREVLAQRQREKAERERTEQAQTERSRFHSKSSSSLHKPPTRLLLLSCVSHFWRWSPKAACNLSTSAWLMPSPRATAPES